MLELMKEGDRGEGDASERIKPNRMQQRKNAIAYGSVCISADYNIPIRGYTVKKG